MSTGQCPAFKHVVVKILYNSGHCASGNYVTRDASIPHQSVGLRPELHWRSSFLVVNPRRRQMTALDSHVGDPLGVLSLGLAQSWLLQELEE